MGEAECSVISFNDQLFNTRRWLACLRVLKFLCPVTLSLSAHSIMTVRALDGGNMNECGRQN